MPNPKGYSDINDNWRKSRDGVLSDDPAEQAIVDALRNQGCRVLPPRRAPFDGRMMIEGRVDLGVLVRAVRNAGKPERHTILEGKE